MLIVCRPQTVPSSLSIGQFGPHLTAFLKAIGLRGKYVNITRSDIGLNLGKLFSSSPSLVTRSLYANESALYWMGLKVRVRGG